MRRWQIGDYSRPPNRLAGAWEEAKWMAACRAAAAQCGAIRAPRAVARADAHARRSRLMALSGLRRCIAVGFLSRAFQNILSTFSLFSRRRVPGPDVPSPAPFRSESHRGTRADPRLETWTG